MIGIKQLATPGVDQPDEVIDGFPEFAFTLSDPSVRERMRQLARRIVASHQTGTRIVGFEVDGHADVTLRLPPGPEREQTELDISRDRAENAQKLLLELIQQEGGGAIIDGIRENSNARFFGAKFAKPATTEADRKRNRRVEIFLRVSKASQAVVPPSIQTVTFWLNAFINKDVKNADGTAMSFALQRGPHSGASAIPGPFNGKVPGFDDCYLTDQRSFDTTKNASSRIHGEVVLDFSGAIPTMRNVKPLGATVDTIRVRVSTGEELNRQRAVADGGFTAGPGFVPGSKKVEVRFKIAGKNPIAKMPRVLVVPPNPLTPVPIPVPLAPSSSDPQSLADPEIDMIGSFVLDAQARTLKFTSAFDGFPFFEAYIIVDGAPVRNIFTLSPEPGSSPATGLPGLPNRVVERDLKL